MAAAQTRRVNDSDNKKKIKIGIAIGCIVLAAAVFFLTSGSPPTFRADQRYFTDDDGKTWFADSTNNIPPYQRNGKTVNGAQIYTTVGGAAPFCAYLVRFPEQVKAQIEKSAASGASRNPPVTAASLAWGTETSQSIEVKPPLKDVPWIPFASPDAAKYLSFKSPDGTDLDHYLPR